MTNKQVNTYINDMKLKWYAENKPLIPPNAIPEDKYKTETANGLTKAVMDLTKYIGGIADRRSSEGRYRPGVEYKTGNGKILGRGTWLPGQNKGIADIEIALPGRLMFVEIKIGKDRQSEVQKKFQKKVELSGNEYHIVKKFEDFIELVGG